MAVVKHWRVNERRPRNNNTTKVNASETTTTMMMMIGRTWVVLLLLLSLVQVQSVRATSLEYAIAAKGIHTVHKANIFDHSKKKGESKKGRSKEGKGAISMPSLSPAPSSSYGSKSKKGGKGKGSKASYPTLSPAPSSSKSLKLKGSKETRHRSGSTASVPTTSPAPSAKIYSSKSKGSKASEGNASTASKKSKEDSINAVPSLVPSVLVPSAITSEMPAAVASSTPTIPLVASPSDSPFAQPSSETTLEPTANVVAAPTGIDTSTPTFTTESPTASVNEPSGTATSTPTVLSPTASVNEPTGTATSTPTIVTASPTASLSEPTGTGTSTPTIATTSPTASLSKPTGTATSTPTMTASPTASVNAPTGTTTTPTLQTTASPIADGSFVVEATPFSITYESVIGTPTPDDCNATSAITISFLQTAFQNFFSSDGLALLTSFNITAFGCTYDPARIGYEATAVFAESSQEDALPLTQSLDTLIQVAYEEPLVTDLLAQLNTLPSDNPFSATTDVLYSTTGTVQSNETADAAQATRSLSERNLEMSFVVSVCAFVFIATSLSALVVQKDRRVLMTRRQRRSVLDMPYHSNLASFSKSESVR